VIRLAQEKTLEAQEKQRAKEQELAKRNVERKKEELAKQEAFSKLSPEDENSAGSPETQYDDHFEDLLELIKKEYSEEETQQVLKAYQYAKEQHKDQRRYSGEPYIMHPVAVARILFELGMDYQSVIAALLHDTVEDTNTSLDDVKNMFGEDVANLVDGVTKLGKVPLSTYEERQAENVRKMLIAMSQDIRVIIIKLADRLHNMRTLQFMRPAKQREKAQETLEIYSPIAHRLGINTVKDELEDLSIRYLDNYGYTTIQNLLSENSKKHPNFVPDTIEKIKTRVREYIPNAEVNGRKKSIYGIYRKMYLQGKSFNQIYDIYAIRVIVDSVTDCYNVLGIVHDMYHSLPNRFKDYISTPKSNMYQSLHTTVISEEGIPFEVQIRTWEMHYTAEYGIAAHWKYKLGVKGSDKFEQRLTWIRQLLESQKDADDVEDIVKTIKTDFIPDDVFVFTPKGDVINIPNGATVIDFAYAIHTEVGNRMYGAKVDGKIVPLDYKVKTGQIVEILRSPDPNKGPSRDWLNIVKTSSARSKIRTWFKKERRGENIEQGKIELERTFRRNHFQLDEEETEELLHTLCRRKGFDNEDDFLAAVGYGSISVDHILPIIREEYREIQNRRNAEELENGLLSEETNEQPARKTSSEGIIVEGVDDVLVKLSKCCNPLPDDEIIGFVTRGHGLSIHKRDCPNVPKDLENCAEPERWVKVRWAKKVKESFDATLKINCEDKIGMMADISTDLASMHVSIQNMSLRNTKKSDDSIIYMTIKVTSAEHLRSVISHLRKIDGVVSVERKGL